MSSNLIEFVNKNRHIQFKNANFLKDLIPFQNNLKIIDPFFDFTNYTLFNEKYDVQINSNDESFLNTVIKNHEKYSRFLSKKTEANYIVTTPPFRIKNEYKKFITQSLELFKEINSIKKLFYFTIEPELLSKEFIEVFEEHLYPETILELDKDYIIGLGVKAYLCIFSKENFENIFYGKIKYGDEQHNKWLFKNLYSRTGNKDVQKGYVSNGKIINSLRKIELDEILKTKLSRIELPLVNIDDIALEISQIDTTKEVDSKENAIYFSNIGISKVVSNLKFYDKIPKKIVEITLNTEKVNPEYVAGFLNSKLGESLRETCQTGSIIEFTRLSDIGKIQLKMPKLKIQTEIVDLINKASILKNHLDFMEERIWKSLRIEDIKKYSKEVYKFDVKGNLNTWIESLPFPLAAILWNYYSSHETNKKIESLLYFFEAFSEFLCILLLSIYRQDNSFYELNKHNWLISDSTHESWYEKSTFGNWNYFLSMLIKFSRKLSNKEEVFGFQSDEFYNILNRKDLIVILNEAKDIRNQFIGHTGVSNESINKQTLTSLESKLKIFQEIIALTFEDIRLIKVKSTIASKEENKHTIYKINGARTPFVESTINLKDHLYTDHIYVHSTNNNHVFKLLDFIRIDIENGASYFYMNIENNHTKWVSYHYYQKPNLNTEISEDFFKVFK